MNDDVKQRLLKLEIYIETLWHEQLRKDTGGKPGEYHRALDAVGNKIVELFPELIVEPFPSEKRTLLKELRDYGWELDPWDPFEYSDKFECVWAHFKHGAFPDMHVCVEIHFEDGLDVAAKIEVSDDNCDGAGDSVDVLTQTVFDPDAIWKACERVMEEREKRWESLD